MARWCHMLGPDCVEWSDLESTTQVKTTYLQTVGFSFWCLGADPPKIEITWWISWSERWDFRIQTSNMDDWDLSAEELDYLERDALNQLAERNRSSTAATTRNSSSSRPNVSSLPAVVPSSRSPAKPTFIFRPPTDTDKVLFLFT